MVSENRNENSPSLKQDFAKAGDSNGEEREVIASEEFKGVSVVGSLRDVAKVEWLLDRLQKVPEGKHLVDNVARDGYTFNFQSSTTACGSCEVEKKEIILNPNISEDRLVATLAHELRHAQQFTRGANHKISEQTTKTKIMTTRAMEADANAYAALVCWNLKNSSHEGPWEQKGDPAPWQKLTETAPEITTAFEKTMVSTKDTSKALAEAFKAWYHERIREIYDDGHIDNLKRIEDEGKAGSLSFAKENSPENIVNVTCFHNGKSYLPNAADVLNSPEYLSVSEKNMAEIKKFFETREQEFGVKADKSLAQIPVRKKDGSVCMLDEPKTKSVVDSKIQQKYLDKLSRG
ncbi:MAG: DUF6782 family putative metallopeptidase [Alphaproteobacteria bacterium]